MCVLHDEIVQDVGSSARRLSLFNLPFLLCQVDVFREHYVCHTERQRNKRTYIGRDNDTNGKVGWERKAETCWLATESGLRWPAGSEKYHMLLQFITKEDLVYWKKKLIRKGS
jgi:hypothetical protein